jgi:hypothetical protein
MLQRALDAGMPFRSFTADEASGHAKYSRVRLEEHHIRHVVAVKSNAEIVIRGWDSARVDHLVAAVPARRWRPASPHRMLRPTDPGRQPLPSSNVRSSHCMPRPRCVYRYAVADRLISEHDNPAS